VVVPGEGVILSPIHLFDRDHPSVPTCACAWPSRAAAVKDGALQRHRRLVLDRREHGGMLGVRRDEESTGAARAKQSFFRLRSRTCCAQRKTHKITHGFL
jgi:hypothetical protein